LAVDERQDHRQAATDLLLPRKALQVGLRELLLDRSDDVLDQRRQTCFTVLEQLVERAARDPRAPSDLRDRGMRVAVLVDRADRTGQQPRALYLRDARRRQGTPGGGERKA